jgi:hypothetical protein
MAVTRRRPGRNPPASIWRSKSSAPSSAFRFVFSFAAIQSNAFACGQSINSKNRAPISIVGYDKNSNLAERPKQFSTPRKPSKTPTDYR